MIVTVISIIITIYTVYKQCHKYYLISEERVMVYVRNPSNIHKSFLNFHVFVIHISFHPH